MSAHVPTVPMECGGYRRSPAESACRYYCPRCRRGWWFDGLCIDHPEEVLEDTWAPGYAFPTHAGEEEPKDPQVRARGQFIRVILWGAVILGLAAQIWRGQAWGF